MILSRKKYDFHDFSSVLINQISRRLKSCLGSGDCGSRTLQGTPKHRRWSVPESPMIPPRLFRPSRAPSGSKSAISKLPSPCARMEPPRVLWKHEMYQTLEGPQHRSGCLRTGSGMTPQLLATLSATFRIFDFFTSTLVFLQIGSDTSFSAF